jgi:hypothetical protein
MANFFGHLIGENEDNANSNPIAMFSLDNMPSDQNDHIANSTQQPSQSARKLSVIAPEPSINSMVDSSFPPFNSSPNLPLTAVEVPSSMSSNSENQEFKFSAAASNFTPASQSRDGGPSDGFYAPAAWDLANGQEALPMTSFQGGSSRDRRPPSYFQTREYHEGSLKNNGRTRAEYSPSFVSSSLYQPQYSLPASNQNYSPPSFEMQTILPLQGAGLHADLFQPQPSLPTLAQDEVLSQAYGIPSSSSQTQLQVPKFTCKNCKWPSTFDDVECVLPLPARPTPSQAWLHRNSGIPHSYLGHFQPDLTEGNNENTEIDLAESSFLPVGQTDLISTDLREKFDFITRTDGTLEHNLDDIVTRTGFQHEPGPPPANTPVYHSELYQRQLHKIALTEILKHTADDREFLQNRIRNIEQWWEHALVDEVDRLTKQLIQTLAKSNDRKKQLSAAQEEIKKLEAEVSKGVINASKLEPNKEQSSECKDQERKFKYLDRQATEKNEEEDQLQAENDQLQAQNLELRKENAKLQERLDQNMNRALEAQNETDNAQDELPTLLATRGRRLIRSGQMTPPSSSSLPSANFSLSLHGMGGLAFPSESIAPARQSAKLQPTRQPRERLEPTGRDEYM